MSCKTCKKKKEVVEQEPIAQQEVVSYTPQQIKLAYDLLGGIKEDEKPFVNSVYKSVLNEEFDWGCTSCVNTQARKLKGYIETVLKIKL